MKILEFAFIVGKLKTIKRAGWIKYGKIQNPESVAEHSFRTAVLAMILAPKFEGGVDQLKVIKMALIHDIAEAEIGDIITAVGKKTLPHLSDKIKQEKEAFRKIFSLVDGDEYVRLFEEFEEGKTPEARLVKQLDRLEMGIQAYEYEQEHKRKQEVFFENVRMTTIDEYLKTILDALEKMRKK